MSDPSRRMFFRIIYPLVERPAFEVGRFVHEVVDVSEFGVRYEIRDRRVPAVGSQVGGTLVFRGGKEMKVTGEVLRTNDGMVVLKLDPPGITFSGILAEQRYLHSKGYKLRE